mmetsp:Transcript_9550/g.35397  ORF Transcript_9550/g.35397 Transcript_9550/m.35397 type:complete len:383 (-) Transcript_9550:986-2134(-)
MSSSGNNNNNPSSNRPQYDPSRLIFAPNRPVKREQGGGAGNAATSSAGGTMNRLGSFRPNTGGVTGAGRFTPIHSSSGSSSTITSTTGPRRFAPKLSGAALKRNSNRPTLVSKQHLNKMSDAESHDLLNTSLMGDTSGGTRPPRGDGPRQQRDRKQQQRKRRDNIVHVGNVGGVFADRKPLQQQPTDIMEVDSSSDEDEKVKAQYEKTPAQLHAEYFDGIYNPPLKLHDGETEETDELFGSNFNSMLREDELFFIQLPSHLPMADKKGANAKEMAAKKQQSVDDEYENVWNQEFDNSLTHLPEGQIGTLKVYKSGKAKLELKSRDGPSILLDVTRAQDHGFCEDLAAIDKEKKKCYSLGSITKRITCVPDCESLLQNVNRED